MYWSAEHHRASLCLPQSRSSNICGCEAFNDRFKALSINPAWVSVSITTFDPSCANGQQTKTFHNLPSAPVRITGNQTTNISKIFCRAEFGQAWRLGWRPEKKEALGFAWITCVSGIICFPDCILIMSCYNTYHSLQPGTILYAHTFPHH